MRCNTVMSHSGIVHFLVVDSWNICNGQNKLLGLCPMPPCHIKSFQEKTYCENFVCRKSEDGAPMDYECIDISGCYGQQQQEDCIDNLIQTNGMDGSDSSYYSDTDWQDAGDNSGSNQAQQYDGDSSSNGSYEANSGGADNSFSTPRSSVTANWLAYAILGGVLTAFILIVIWRKRVSSYVPCLRLSDPCQLTCIIFQGKIENDDLGEELEPHGESLSGAVARHHAKTNGGVAV